MSVVNIQTGFLICSLAGNQNHSNSHYKKQNKGTLEVTSDSNLKLTAEVHDKIYLTLYCQNSVLEMIILTQKKYTMIFNQELFNFVH